MVGANQLREAGEVFGIGKPISENLLGYIIAVMVIAGVLTFLESNISRKSAMSMFVLILLGMIITQPRVLATLSLFINRAGGVLNG